MDSAVAAYVEWREACTAVRRAYWGWVCAPVVDATLAYLAYVVALDREQAAADTYGRLMRSVGHLIECGLDYPLDVTFCPPSG